MWHSNKAMGGMHPIEAGGVVPRVTSWSKKLLAASSNPILTAHTEYVILNSHCTQCAILNT